MIDLPPDPAFQANTPRLRLVLITPDDGEELFLLLNDQRLHQHVGGLPMGLPELMVHYRAIESRRSADGREVRLDWAVRLVPLGEAVGTVTAVVTEDSVATLSFVVGSRYQSHGFAVEALRAVIRMLEGHLMVTDLRAVIRPGNTPAAGVLRAVGMSRAAADDDDEGRERWDGHTAHALALGDAAEVAPAASAASRGRTRRARAALFVRGAAHRR